MKKLLIIFFCLFPFSLSVALAGDSGMSSDFHRQRGDIYFQNNQHFSAINEYEQAVQKDAKNPETLRKLSLLHYDLGFLDESVSEMEKAVSLSPGAEMLRMDLGIAYFAKGRLENAKEQFMAAVSKNPGLANAYYYLGEILYRTKDYNTAWMFAKRSRCLGHKGNDLFRKLASVSVEPKADLCAYAGEDLHIRQILVETKSGAEAAVRRIAEGELFEDVAMMEDRNREMNAGGYLGKFSPSQLDQNILKALAGSRPFSAPVIVETGAGFHVIQKIAPFEINEWKKQISGAVNTPKAALKPPAAPITSTLAKTGQKEAAPSSGQPKEVYLLYAGSNREEKNAAKDVEKLISLGYPAYRYEETTESKGTFHIVVAGKYESFDNARQAGEVIARHGFQYFIQKAE
jgi:Flp pilus assembly protein TadD/cell division septation protein DedD